jgi:GMP synthase-like glutamine amidotransferase
MHEPQLSRARRAVVLQHEQLAPPGLVATWARRRDIELDVVRLDLGERPPEPDTTEMGMILGSSASVFDVEVPWIGDELAWISNADAAGLPLLGICFGAQALATALGGSVRRAATPEVGWIDVAPNRAPFATGPWLAWHRDVLEPPPGAVALARNHVGIQAFGLSPHLAVQFHPEVTADIVGSWITTLREEYPGVGWDVERLRAETARSTQAAADNAFALFDDFLRSVRVVGRPARGPASRRVALHPPPG